MEMMKSRLTQELHYLEDETEKLMMSREELEHGLEMLTRPEQVCVRNLQDRDFRQGIELVEDNVQSSLRHEIQVNPISHIVLNQILLMTYPWLPLLSLLDCNTCEGKGCCMVPLMVSYVITIVILYYIYYD